MPASNVGPKGPYNLVLRDSASETTTVGLVLAEDAEGRPSVQESRVDLVPPRQSEGALSWTHLDPAVDMHWSMDDWSGGALKPTWEAGLPNKYALSDGCDLRWDNVATLGMKRNTRIDFIIRNPGAELGATTGWTADTGSTFTAPAGAANSGSYGFRATGPSADGDYYQRQDLANFAAYKGRTITIIARVRRTAGGHKATLSINDGVGTTNGSLITSASFVFATVTRAIDVNATQVRIGLRDEVDTVGPSTTTYETDDWAIIPAGGVINVGVAEKSDVFYGAFGRTVCQWDETNDVWNAVYIHASVAATSIVGYADQIYVAFGGGDTAYIYGSTTSWTVSTVATPTADAKFAHYFVVSRGVLWKSRKDATDGDHDQVASSSNPANGGSWSGEYAVGAADREITGLFSFNDTIVVGKEDGLHIYLRVYADGASADLFKNITNEWSVFVDPDNFSRAQEHSGWLYLIASQQSFFRYNADVFQDLSSLLLAPKLTDFGGRVRAMTSDPIQLWMLVDTPTADTTDAKTTWLMSLRERRINEFLLHTIEKVSIGDIRTLAANRGFLWALGRVYNTDAADYEAAIYRWTLPTKVAAPAFDVTPAINTSGYFETSEWHGGVPGLQKALVQAIGVLSDADAEHTVAVRFGVNGAVATTTLLGTFNGTGTVQTLDSSSLSSPTTSAIGRTFKFRCTLATDDTVSPKLHALVLRFVLRPQRVKQWVFVVRVGGPLRNGMPDPVSKTTLLANLSTLETQVYPIQMIEDLDQNDTSTTTNVLIKVERAIESDQPLAGELYRLTVQEVV